MQVEPGKRYRLTDNTVVFIVRVDPGAVEAWPDPVDVEYVIEEGKHPGKKFVSSFAIFEGAQRVG